MTTLKKGEAPPDLIDEVVNELLDAKRILEIIPFDPIPGGRLTYKKKKDEDNE